MIAVIALPLLFLRWLLTPVGAIVGLLGIGALLIQAAFDRTMPDAEVPRYVRVGAMIRGPHVSGASTHAVVTLQVVNTHPDRSTPANLWVACSAYGTAHEGSSSLGSYETLLAFRAGLLIDYNNKLMEQTVPAASTKALDFDTQAALPNHNLRTGDAVGTCVLGVTKAQAFALVGYREGTDRQGRMLSTTPQGRALGTRTGWDK